MIDILSLNNDITHALKDLDKWLKEQGIELEIIIIGAYALFLHGLEFRATNDIDTLTELRDEKLLEAIESIAVKHSLQTNWLNDQAIGISLPEDFHKRLTRLKVTHSITVLVPSRQDLISLKAAAYVIRGEVDPKDFLDLTLLKPSKSEIDMAIKFVKETQSPPQPKFFPDFEEVLRKLYGTVK